MYFRGPHGRLALPNESPSLNKANLLTYLLTATIEGYYRGKQNEMKQNKVKRFGLFPIIFHPCDIYVTIPKLVRQMRMSDFIFVSVVKPQKLENKTSDGQAKHIPLQAHIK